MTVETRLPAAGKACPGSSSSCLASPIFDNERTSDISVIHHGWIQSAFSISLRPNVRFSSRSSCRGCFRRDFCLCGPVFSGGISTKRTFASEANPDIQVAAAPKADWIWTAGVPANQVPRGSAYFRKSIQFSALEQAQLQIGANDAYEVFVNGRRVGSDNVSENLKTIDITSFVRPGNNVFAVRAENTQGTTAGLLARLYVKPRNEGWRGLGTSETWLASPTATTGWQSPDFDDSNWKNARPINGPASTPAPMQTVASRVNIQGDPTSNDIVIKAKNALPPTNRERFSVDDGFVVEELLDHEATGSLIAMAFNEFGHIVASQEGGPLLLIYDANKDGKPEKVRTYSDRVKNIQGILPLNGDVFVTGDGEQGNGLYRLMDQNRDGKLEQSSLIVGFTGVPGEHGAHQLVLGPDGMLYVVLGNHVQVAGKVDPRSPYSAVYEGDLVQPREEDPGGHAQGIKAPEERSFESSFPARKSKSSPAGFATHTI